jgi:hypothetical protein
MPSPLPPMGSTGSMPVRPPGTVFEFPEYTDQGAQAGPLNGDGASHDRFDGSHGYGQ